MPEERKRAIPIPGLRWRGFTLQLFFLTILPLTVLLLVIAFGSLRLHHEAMRSLVGDRDLRATRAAANSLSQQVSHRLASIQMLAEQPGEMGGLVDRAIQAPGVSDDFQGGVALFSPDGKLIQSALTARDDASALEAIARDTAERAALPRGPGLSTPFQLSGNGPYWVMAASQTRDGSLLAGLFAPASLAQEALTGAVDPATATVVLAGPGGAILYQSGPLAGTAHLADHPGIAGALQGESGIDYMHAAEGEHVVAFSPVAGAGWGLVLEESWESVASPLLNATQSAPLILAPLLLLALVALWFGARQVIQPLQALQSSSEALAKGDFQAIEQPVGGISEIRALQSDLVEMAHSLRLAQDSLHSYIGAITAGVESERHNLARELHDDTLQTLIALQQRIQLAGRAANPDLPLAEAEQVTGQAITNLRRMVRGLRPIYLEDLGLVAALKMLADETAQNGDLPVAFDCTGEERRLPPESELALYRMAQEALSNILRHAEARQARVKLEFDPAGVRLTIQDDGKGFTVPSNPSEFAGQGHYGLLGLHERAEVIGAALLIDSRPGQGTTIEIRA